MERRKTGGVKSKRITVTRKLSREGLQLKTQKIQPFGARQKGKVPES